MAVGLVLALGGALWLVLRVPAPESAAPVTPADIVYAPTVAPTEAVGASSTIVTPEGDYATQVAGEQATIIARATASPFPTAGPAAVQTGQPSIASARRGGLSLQVRLAKNSYRSGEAGWA